MASKKKQSEGIALLSMYNDEEEEDEEMEDAGGEDEEDREPPRDGGEGDGDRLELRSFEDASMADSDRALGGDSGDDENTPGEVFGGLRNSAATQLRPPTPQMSHAVNSDKVRSKRGNLAIVDYGHDEVTMSPEPEDGEVERSGRITFARARQSENGDFRNRTTPGTVQALTPSNQATPQLSDPSQSDKVNYAVSDSEAGDAAIGTTEEEKDIDPLNKFLPPPPKAKCSEELQRKINKFLDYKKAGKSFNAEVRNRKDYRNPDFLLHAVRYQDIDQIGSCFNKDVFDPHGYDKSDYYDEIEADMRREMDRREQERKKNQKVEFLSAGPQPGIVGGANKVNLPVPGVPTTAAIVGLHTALPSADTILRDGRHNKKSKWDKVDSDWRNSLPSGVQDPTLAVGAQTIVPSVSSAGAGYMAFVQQRRREAEEKKSSDRKLERRS